MGRFPSVTYSKYTNRNKTTYYMIRSSVQYLLSYDFRNKLLIVNFWATWCAPCREEMPSLDLLQSDKRLSNLKVFPINVGKEDIFKSKVFFKELNIKNLDIYFDPTVDLANKFLLRGLPTTILINKKGQEFARIIGYVDFNDQKFINWLKNFN